MTAAKRSLQWTLFLISIYTIFGALQSLLVRMSQTGRDYTYEPAAVVLLVELFKLTLSLVVSLTRDSEVPPAARLRIISQQRDIFMQFAVPAFLYFVYNVLMFFNLKLVEPSTYRVIITSKVLWSGLIQQQVFPEERLSPRKWMGLVLLLLGCALEQLGSFNLDTGLLALGGLSFQAVCSSTAGVYNQWLLKRRDDARTMGLWEKNIFMYSWGVIFSLVFLLFFRPDLISVKFFSIFESGLLWFIIASSAFMGLATSFLLRDANVLVKEYANFAEMCLVVVASYALFGSAIKWELAASVIIVFLSLYLYNVEPAPDSPKAAASHSPQKPRADTAEEGEGPDVESATELAQLIPSSDGDKSV